MKVINEKEMDAIQTLKLEPDQEFHFQCLNSLSCYMQCCRNLILYLHPHDIINLKNSLGISSDQFIEQHTDMILREPNYFPDLVLKMTETPEKLCPFLNEQGCSVYTHRPGTCRLFPIEHGILMKNNSSSPTPVFYFKPSEFCQGPKQSQTLTPKSWMVDQKATFHYQMSLKWASVKQLFYQNPWGAAGINNPNAKMAIMACYNVDQFRSFIFDSSFLKRFKLKKKLIQKIKQNDFELLEFGYEWIKFFIWKMPSQLIIPKK